MKKMPKFEWLSPKAQDAIKRKALWEKMSLTAVMIEWPELWEDDVKEDEGVAR